MSDSKLRAFADQAETLVTMPDLERLERRGHDLRNRRRTTVAAAIVLVALLGTWVVQDRMPRADRPDTVDTPVRAYDPYPGNEMHTLEAGTYELFPSAVDGEPTALVTLPEGWNDWEGPNRFNGHSPDDPTTGRYNEVALGRSTWSVAVLVVKLLAVTRDVCRERIPHKTWVDTYGQTVRALSRIPGYRLVEAPTKVKAFGYDATHFMYGATAELPTCADGADVYVTSNSGAFGGQPTMEIWVMDVAGVPLTVIASTDGDVPPRIRQEQAGVVSSIEFLTHDQDS